MAPLEKHLGLGSGIGLVVANMIGAGVFLSTGFMSQSLPPGHILLAWVVGAALALCGARAYAEVAARVPGSGGEYRYVSTLLHPALGSLAGWASLLVGFSAPIAVDALAAGLFANAVVPGLPPLGVAVSLIVGLTALHAVRLDVSRNAQGALVLLKLLLVFGFIAVGVAKGSLAWPTWNPPSGAPAGFPLSSFMSSLFFIAFAFSGWNAAVYAAGEFKDARDVPRAMLLGCAGVGALYLVMNYLFVANITPTEGTIVFKYGSEPVTLGHAVMKRWAGEGAAGAMSAIVVLLFISAMSAMILLGPRVYAAMAKDGYLPKALAEKEGRPPTLAVLLQGALALALVFIQSIKETLANVGAVLVLFSALTVAGLFRPSLKDVPLAARLAAGVYVLSAAWMLYFGVTSNPLQYLWVLGAAALGFGFHALQKRQPA